MNEQERKNAEKVFATLCRMLDGNGWKYEKQEQNFKITCSARGEDLSIDLRMQVDPQSKVVLFYSPMFSVAEDKKSAFAVAVVATNYRLTIGCFDFDIRDGSLSFRIAVPFRDSILSEGMFGDVLYTTCATVDKYNDKLLLLAIGKMTLNDYLDFVYKS